MISKSMPTDTYILDPEKHTGSDVLRMLDEGKHPVCPKCGARLLVALSAAEAKRQRTPPGIRCPNDPKHFDSTAYLTSAKELWKAFDSSVPSRKKGAQ